MLLGGLSSTPMALLQHWAPSTHAGELEVLPWHRADMWASNIPAWGWLGGRHMLPCPFLGPVMGGRDREHPTC